MYKLPVLLACIAFMGMGCHKNNQSNAHTAAPPQNQNNNTNTNQTQTVTLSATEWSLVGTWYYERQDAISGGTIVSTSTYSGNPAFNTITFSSSASPISTNTTSGSYSVYPNFKEYNRVINGNPINEGAWKIPNTGNLLLSIAQTQTDIIDSLTATRLVYREGAGYPVVTGQIYTLHK